MTGLTRQMTGAALEEQLEGWVLSGEWPPGHRLPSERQLAEEFQLSRPVVRETLRNLTERGLLSVVPGRGRFVRESRPTQGDTTVELMARRGQVTARHLMVARRMLESEAAHLAALNHNTDDVRQMKTILSALDSKSSEVGVSAELDVAFHEAIAVASANPVIQIMFGSIRPLTHGLVLRSLTDRDVRQAGLPYHQRILDAVLAHDAEAAREAMATHLSLAEEYYGQDLDRPLADVLRSRADYQPRVAELLRQVSASMEREGPNLPHPPVFRGGSQQGQ